MNHTRPVELSTPLVLPCGAVLPNRIVKSAMTEGLADPAGRATEEHVRLYRRWARGGTGMLLTGNIQVDMRSLERPGNIVLEGPQDADRMARLRAVADAGALERRRNLGAAFPLRETGRRVVLSDPRRPVGRAVAIERLR